MKVARTDLEAVGSLAMMSISAMIVFASALVAIPLSFGNLFLIFAVGDAFASGALIGLWTLAWFPAALFTSYLNLVAGLESVNDPEVRRVSLLIGRSGAILITFPSLWVPIGFP